MPEPRITHPEKVLFPRDGYTKADMVAYYQRVADVMLPYLQDHPLAMLRFNDGIDGERFYHKRAPKYFPDYIDRVELEFSDGKAQYLVCNNEDALLYIANHNCVEYHVLTVATADLWHPDRLIFDFDPTTENFDEIRTAARAARDLFDEVGLPSYVMVSGSRGLHVWCPLDRSANVEEVRGFCDDAAGVLVSRLPDLLTTEFAKKDRGTKIYVDVARNAPGQHAVCPFSLRAKDGAPAATPITWDEVDDIDPQSFNLANMEARLKDAGDPWKGMTKKAKALAPAMKKLARLADA